MQETFVNGEKQHLIVPSSPHGSAPEVDFCLLTVGH